MSVFQFRNYIIFLFFILCSSSVYSFTLSGTRLIYNENKPAASMDIRNGLEVAEGAQVWIEKYDEHYFLSQNAYENFTSEQDSFSITPAFLVVEKNSKNSFSINLLSSENLSREHETLFALYVRGLPNDINKEGGTKSKASISLAQQVKIKLIFRPAKLYNKRTKAEENLIIKCSSGLINIDNPTGYIFSPIEYSISGEKKKFTKLITPGVNNTQISCSNDSVDSVKIKFINDYGVGEYYEY